MNWTDILDKLLQYDRDKNLITQNQYEECAHSNSIVLTGNPRVKVYRQKRNVNSFSTPHGNCSYDSYGSLLMATSDPYPDAIYADSVFLTRVSCEVILSKAHFLSMKPDKLANIRNIFRKAPDNVVHWSVKSNFSETIIDKILTYLKTENQECIKRISIQLISTRQSISGEHIHNLIISTSILPDNLNNFCLVNDFYPFKQQDEKNVSDFETSVWLVEGMIRYCRSLFSILSENAE